MLLQEVANEFPQYREKLSKLEDLIIKLEMDSKPIFTSPSTIFATNIESLKTTLALFESTIPEQLETIVTDMTHWNDFIEKLDSLLSYLDSKMELLNLPLAEDNGQITEQLQQVEVYFPYLC